MGTAADPAAGPCPARSLIHAYPRRSSIVSLRIEISDKCTGHGRCYVLSPELFEPDDEGYGVVTEKVVDGDEQRASARLAAESCPEGAIALIEQS
jgi:ferredoxin